MTDLISGSQTTQTDFYYIGCPRCETHVKLVIDKISGKFFAICEGCQTAMTLDQFHVIPKGKTQ